MHLNELCSPNEVLLVYSGDYDKDSAIFPFDPNIYYYFLTGISIANSYFAYYPKTKQSIIYYPSINPIWNDDYTRMNAIYSTDKQFQYKPFTNLLKDLYIAKPKKILSNHILHHPKVCNEFKVDIVHLKQKIDKLREIKTRSQIEKIRESCRVNSELFRGVIAKAKRYTNESQIVNDLEYELKKVYSSGTFSYLPICSNGPNNSILHYIYNKKPIRKPNLILLDAGCKIDGYCSDITRTFPSSGKFTKNQRKIYSIVLKCYKYSLDNIRSGSSFRSIETSMRLLMYNELLDLGFITPQKTEKDKINITKNFMPHSLGHSMGLETHDKPDHLDILLEGMVITVEPGIYFNKTLLTNIPLKNLEEYLDLGGVRIEDVVLVTKDGYENLVDIPVEVEEIEKLIQ